MKVAQGGLLDGGRSVLSARVYVRRVWHLYDGDGVSSASRLEAYKLPRSNEFRHENSYGAPRTSRRRGILEAIANALSDPLPEVACRQKITQYL